MPTPLRPLFLAAMLTSPLAAASLRPVPGDCITRSEVIAPHGMVCTSHPLATQAGLDVLKAGGSAVDAAIFRGA